MNQKSYNLLRQKSEVLVLVSTYHDSTTRMVLKRDRQCMLLTNVDSMCNYLCYSQVANADGGCLQYRQRDE